MDTISGDFDGKMTRQLRVGRTDVLSISRASEVVRRLSASETNVVK